MTEALARKETESTVSMAVSDLQARMQFEGDRIRLMKEFVSGQMTVGVHYGKIPGTAGKMTLLKPGAELLTNIHGMHPEFIETERVCDRTASKSWRDKYGKDRTTTGYVKYSFRCSLMKGDAKVGEGVGTCNSWERKYLAVDVDDAENTVLKMSKKRAFIDAVLTATRTSDFFSQDMEDRADSEDQHPTQEEASQDEPGSNDGPPVSNGVISEPQRRRLFAISKAAQESQGWDDAKLKRVMDDLLMRFGFNTSKDITRDKYQTICTEVESWK